MDIHPPQTHQNYGDSSAASQRSTVSHETLERCALKSSYIFLCKFIVSVGFTSQIKTPMFRGLIYLPTCRSPALFEVLLCHVTPCCFSDVLLIWNFLSVYLLLVLLPLVSSPGTGTWALLWWQFMWLNQLNVSELKYLLIDTPLAVSWVISWRPTKVPKVT